MGAPPLARGLSAALLLFSLSSARANPPAPAIPPDLQARLEAFQRDFEAEERTVLEKRIRANNTRHSPESAAFMRGSVAVTRRAELQALLAEIDKRLEQTAQRPPEAQKLLKEVREALNEIKDLVGERLPLPGASGYISDILKEIKPQLDRVARIERDQAGPAPDTPKKDEPRKDQGPSPLARARESDEAKRFREDSAAAAAEEKADPATADKLRSGRDLSDAEGALARAKGQGFGTNDDSGGAGLRPDHAKMGNFGSGGGKEAAVAAAVGGASGPSLSMILASAGPVNQSILSGSLLGVGFIPGRELLLKVNGERPSSEEVGKFIDDLRQNQELYARVVQLYADRKGQPYEALFKDIGLRPSEELEWTENCRKISLQDCNELAGLKGVLYTKGQLLSLAEVAALESRIAQASSTASDGHRRRMDGLKALLTLPGKPGTFNHGTYRNLLAFPDRLSAAVQSLKDRPASSPWEQTDWVDARARALRELLLGEPGQPMNDRQRAWHNAAADETVEEWKRQAIRRLIALERARGGTKQVENYYTNEWARGVRSLEEEEKTLQRIETELTEFFSVLGPAVAKLNERWAMGLAEAAAADPKKAEELREAVRKSFSPEALAAMPEGQRKAFERALSSLAERLENASRDPRGALQAMNEFFDQAAARAATEPEVVGYLRIMQSRFQEQAAAGQAQAAMTAMMALVPGGFTAAPRPGPGADLGLAAAFALDALPFQDLFKASGAQDWAKRRIDAYNEARFAAARAVRLKELRAAAAQVKTDGQDLSDEEFLRAFESESPHRRLKAAEGRLQVALAVLADDKATGAILLSRKPGEPEPTPEQLQERVLDALKSSPKHAPLLKQIEDLKKEVAELKTQAEAAEKAGADAVALEEYDELRRSYHAFMNKQLAMGAIPDGKRIPSQEFGMPPGADIVPDRQAGRPGYWVAPVPAGPEVFTDLDGKKRAVRIQAPDPKNPGQTVTAYSAEGEWDENDELVNGTERQGPLTRVYSRDGDKGRRIKESGGARGPIEEYQVWGLVKDERSGQMVPGYATAFVRSVNEKQKHADPNLSHYEYVVVNPTAENIASVVYDADLRKALGRDAHASTLLAETERWFAENGPVQGRMIGSVTFDTANRRVILRMADNKEFSILSTVYDESAGGTVLIEERFNKANGKDNLYATAMYGIGTSGPDEGKRIRIYDKQEWDPRTDKPFFTTRREVLVGGQWTPSQAPLRDGKVWGDWVDPAWVNRNTAGLWDNLSAGLKNHPLSVLGEGIYHMGDFIMSGLIVLGGLDVALREEILAVCLDTLGAREWAQTLHTAAGLSALNTAVEASRKFCGTSEFVVHRKGQEAEESCAGLLIKVISMTPAAQEDKKWFLGDQREKFLVSRMNAYLEAELSKGGLFKENKEYRKRKLDEMRARFAGFPSAWDSMIHHDDFGAFAEFVFTSGAGVAGGLAELSSYGPRGELTAKVVGFSLEASKSLAGGMAFGAGVGLLTKGMAMGVQGAVGAQRTEKLLQVLHSGSKLNPNAPHSLGDLARVAFGSPMKQTTAELLQGAAQGSSKARLMLLAQTLEIPVNTVQMADTLMMLTGQALDGDHHGMAMSVFQQAGFALAGAYKGRRAGLRTAAPSRPLEIAAETGPASKKIGVKGVPDDGEIYPSPDGDGFIELGPHYNKNQIKLSDIQMPEAPTDAGNRRARRADALVRLEQAKYNKERVAKAAKKSDPEAKVHHDSKDADAFAEESYDRALEKGRGMRKTDLSKDAVAQGIKDGTVAPGVDDIDLQNGNTCTLEALKNQINTLRGDKARPLEMREIEAIVRKVDNDLADALFTNKYEEGGTGLRPTEMLTVYKAVARELGVGLEVVAPQRLFREIAARGQGAAVAINTGVRGHHEVFLEGTTLVRERIGVVDAAELAKLRESGKLPKDAVVTETADGLFEIARDVEHAVYLDSNAGGRTSMPLKDFARILRSGGVFIDPAGKPARAWDDQIKAFAEEFAYKRSPAYKEALGRLDTEKTMRLIRDDAEFRKNMLAGMQAKGIKITEQGLLEEAKKRLAAAKPKAIGTSSDPAPLRDEDADAAARRFEEFFTDYYQETPREAKDRGLVRALDSSIKSFVESEGLPPSAVDAIRARLGIVPPDAAPPAPAPSPRDKALAAVAKRYGLTPDQVASALERHMKRSGEDLAELEADLSRQTAKNQEASWNNRLSRGDFFEEELGPLLEKDRPMAKVKKDALERVREKVRDDKRPRRKEGKVLPPLPRQDGGEIVKQDIKLYRHIYASELEFIIAENGLASKGVKGEASADLSSVMGKYGGIDGVVEARVDNHPDAKHWFFEFTQHGDREGLGGGVATAGPIKIEIVPRPGQTFIDTGQISAEKFYKAESGWATADPIHINQIRLYGPGCEGGCALTSPEGKALAKKLLADQKNQKN